MEFNPSICSTISFHKHKKKGKAVREYNKETFVNTFYFPASFVLPLIQGDLTFLALSFLRIYFCTGDTIASLRVFIVFMFKYIVLSNAVVQWTCDIM